MTINKAECRNFVSIFVRQTCKPPSVNIRVIHEGAQDFLTLAETSKDTTILIYGCHRETRVICRLMGLVDLVQYCENLSAAKIVSAT